MAAIITITATAIATAAESIFFSFLSDTYFFRAPVTLPGFFEQSAVGGKPGCILAM